MVYALGQMVAVLLMILEKAWFAAGARIVMIDAWSLTIYGVPDL